MEKKYFKIKINEVLYAKLNLEMIKLIFFVRKITSVSTGRDINITLIFSLSEAKIKIPSILFLIIRPNVSTLHIICIFFFYHSFNLFYYFSLLSVNEALYP